MAIRSFVYSVVMIAYSLSLAHSFIPHHHFDSYTEFKAGHHHENDNHDHHDGGENDNEEQADNSLFVGTHIANVDISITSYSFKKAQDKAPQYNIGLVEDPHTLEFHYDKSVFHVPIRPPLINHFHLSSLLRAPPLLS